MRKILFLIATIFFALTINAKDIKHMIYLNNGKVITGQIIEQIPDSSIKVKTMDGLVFEYKMSEVSKITREQKPYVPEDPNGKHYGLDFSINTGYLIGVGDYKKAGVIPVEFGLGKQVSKYFYAGGYTGAFINTQGASNTSIPLGVDAKIMFPGESPVIPFIGLSLGYNFITGVKDMDDESKEIYEEMYGKKYDGPSNGMFVIQFMPGIKVPISKSVDYYLSAGYTHAFVNRNGGNGGYFSIKTGLFMHKNPNKPLRKKRLPVPTRDHGFQWTMEAGVGFDNTGGGGDMVFGYKINPHFNVGLGLGYYASDPFAYGNDGAEVITVNQNGGAQIEDYYLKGPVSSFKTYLRGVYRITDKKCSPFVSCDAGMRFYSYASNVYSQHFYSWNTNLAEEVLGAPEKTACFISPALGVSLRTTKNSYLELKAGYSLAPKILGRKVSTEIDGVKYYGSCVSAKMSYPFITLGFSHTFGKKGDRK